MQTTKQQRRTRRAFSPQFKAEVVGMCRAGDRSIGQVAEDLDLTESSVRRWVEQAEIDEGRKEGLSSAEREELAACAARGA